MKEAISGIRFRPLRVLFHQTDVGLPHFVESNSQVVLEAKKLVDRIHTINPRAQLSQDSLLHHTITATDFAKPRKLANNPHAEHNLRHIKTVRVIVQYVANYMETDVDFQKKLQVLGRPFNIVAAEAASEAHDIERNGDYVDSVLRLGRHGRLVAKRILSKQLFPDLDSDTRKLAATSVIYHDVDTRANYTRQPEEELVALIDRGELARLIYGIGPVARMGRRLGNYFAHRQGEYDSYYFPKLMQTFQPIFKAMLLLGVENINKGMDQQEAVFQAARELGIIKHDTESQISERRDIAA